MELEALLVIIIFIFIAITSLLGTTVVLLYQRLKEMFDFTLLITEFYEKERERERTRKEAGDSEIPKRS